MNRFENSNTHEPNTQFDKLITGNKKKGKEHNDFFLFSDFEHNQKGKAVYFFFPLLIADHYRSNLIVTFVLMIKHRNSFILSSNGFFIFMQIKNDIL